MPKNQQFTLKDKNTMREDISNIKYHMDVLNGETGELRDLFKKIDSNVAEGNLKTVQIQTDVDWLKRSFWVVATTSFGALVAALFNLVTK